MIAIKVEAMAGIGEVVEVLRSKLAQSQMELRIDMLPNGIKFEMVGPRSKLGVRRTAQWAVPFQMLADLPDPAGFVKESLVTLERHWRSVDA